MGGSEISERVKYSISIEMEFPGYESARYLPDSLVVNFDRKKEQMEAKGIQEYSNQLVRHDDKVPTNEVMVDNKLKLFIDIFRALAGDNRDDVKKETLVLELVDTGKFTEQEAILYIVKAQQYGFIFERRIGTYALT